MPRFVTSLIVALLMAQRTLAQEEEKPPVPTEKILETSPDGKFAMRIKYDKTLNDQMLSANNPKPAHDIFSEAISMIELFSLPEKEVVATLFDPEKEVGNNFEITLLWSSDSKWCAFSWSYPRTGYTTVYHLRGKKFEAANKPEELSPPTKGSVRNEHILPKRWVKPGTLELSVERVFRGNDEGDGVSGFTARFDGKGKFQILKKIR
jgi:hypothetical protein